MKKLVFVLLLLAVVLPAFSQQNVRFNVTASDPVTGKRIKYTNVEVRFQYGEPIEFIGSISFHETNDSPAAHSGSTAQAKRIVESYMENYSTVGRVINSATLVYLPSLTDSLGVPRPNAVLLKNHLALKALNSYPGTAGGDPVWKFIEGLCKEMIAVRKANGEFVN